MKTLPDNPSDAVKRRNPNLFGYPPMTDDHPVPADAVEVESDLHDAIIKYAKHKGWIYFHGSMAHRTFRVTGEPDFQIFADRGRTFLIECKTAKSKLTAEQLGLALWAEKLGHKIHLVRSVAEFLEVVR